MFFRGRFGLPFFMVSIITCGPGETGLALLGKHASKKRTNSPSDSMNNVTGRYAVTKKEKHVYTTFLQNNVLLNMNTRYKK